MTKSEQKRGVATTRLVADVVVSGLGDVWEHGAIDIDRSGRITACGPVTDLGSPPGDVQKVDGLLMPGFVNAHAHSPMTLLRSVGDGAELDDWLKNHIWPREAQMTPQMAFAGMMLGSAEMLLAGITTSLEMYAFEEQVAEAATVSGQRVVVAGGIFSGALDGTDPSARLDELDATAAKFASNDLVTIGYGPHSPYDLAPETLKEIGRRAKATSTPVTIHLEETQAERELVLGAQGKSATQVLADMGFLDAKPVCAHGVWLSGLDRELLASHGASVAHCPSSNMKLGSGIARTARMIDSGIGVALGTDGPASNDRLDLWEEMRTAALLSRAVSHDPGAMTAAQAFEMATVKGGLALGRPDLGHLSPGAAADIVRVDLDRPALVPFDLDSALETLVFAGSGSCVTDVWVAGRPVVSDRALVNIDIASVIQSAADRPTLH